MNYNKDYDNNRSSTGWVFLGGLLVGWLTSVLISNDNFRNGAKGRVRKLRKELEDEDLENRIKNIFGQYSRDLTEKYQSLKNDLIDKLSRTKEAGGKISESKYRDAVSEIVDRIKDGGDFTADQLDKIKYYLEQDYEKLKRHES